MMNFKNPINSIEFFINGYSFDRIETEKNITPSFAQYKLAVKFEELGNLSSEDKLYADIRVSNCTTRWVLDYHNCCMVEVFLNDFTPVL